MGAILAILGEAGDPELTEGLQRMLARSPYRGEPEFLVEGPLTIGLTAGASTPNLEIGRVVRRILECRGVQAPLSTAM